MFEEMQWETVERGTTPLETEVWVSVRRTGFKISAGFFDAINIREKSLKYVLLKINHEHQAIMFHFLSDADLSHLRAQSPFVDGVFKLNPDGGGWKRSALSKGAVIQSGALIQHTDWLYAAASDEMRKRKRYLPERGKGQNEWVVRFVPGFIYQSAAHSCDVAHHLKGVYCYISESGEIVYIGQGKIRSRFSRHIAEKSIVAKWFRWTPIEDDATRVNAESHHLRAFFQKFGRLPKYNVMPAQRIRRKKDLITPDDTP